MRDDPPRRHLRAIDACNQRGGRMLSVVDLVRAGTLDLALAAWLMKKISSGTPYVVGANPGGAGKTTVMCALLNFVPAEAELVPAESLSRVLEARRGDWLLCHEVGRGSYYAYLWGEAVAELFRAPRRGVPFATNLHADTIEEARAALVGSCGVEEEDFERALYLFMSFEGRRRRVGRVWEGSREVLVSERDAPEAELRFLRALVEEGVPEMEHVRGRVVSFLSSGHAGPALSSS